MRARRRRRSSPPHRTARRGIFPHTVAAFTRRFPDDEACWRYLVDARWPGGFRCPDGHVGSLIASRKLFQCRGGQQWSATAGTTMHRTKIPLTIWFQATYLLIRQVPPMSARQFARRLLIDRERGPATPAYRVSRQLLLEREEISGVSALQLARQLGLNYETSYVLLQKLRGAMAAHVRDKLRGTAEVDWQSGFGSPFGPKNPPRILGAVELSRGGSARRLRLRVLPARTPDDLLRWLREAIEQGSIVRTDRPLEGVETAGYKHQVIRSRRGKVTRIGRAFYDLQRWLVGTHHAVSRKHLQAYLDEFAFRFDHRRSPEAALRAALGITGTNPSSDGARRNR